MNVAINGLGRIGRAALKQILDTPNLDLVAVNDIVAPDALAYMLRYDSVYGRYSKSVKAEGDSLNIDGQNIKVLNVKDPAELPWDEMNIEVVIESTGVFTKPDELKKHVQAGAKHVVLSAPVKGEGVDMVVHGVNTPEGEQIISCASCTTNCITPVVEILDRRIGIQKANMTTIHAYTSSQAIVDGPHKKWRRGRAGALNFVPTSTGAASATAKALPQIEGKFDGVAVRGPVPVGSLADLNFVLKKSTTADEVNQIFKEEAESDRYKGIVGVSDDNIVSSDIIQDDRASIIDLTMTQVVDGDLLKVMSWYDNEWGYAAQMIREIKRMMK